MIAEKDRKLFQILDILQTANIVVSIVSNCFLLWIIIKYSKALFNYRFLLIAFALNDIWIPIVHLLTAPIICSYRDAFITFSKGVFTSKFSICYFGATFSQTMPIMAHLFLYRFFVLKWPSLAQFYTGRNTALIILLTILMQGILWCANCLLNYDPDDELRQYVQPFLDSDFPGEGGGFIGVLYWNENGLRSTAILSTIYFNCLMTFWSIVIGICSVLIVRILNESETKWSIQTRNLQRQLFRTLLAQILIPLAFVFLPCAGITNCPIFWHFSVCPNLAPTMVTIFPIGDAIITLVGVRMFREQCFAYFRSATGLDFSIKTRAMTT